MSTARIKISDGTSWPNPMTDAGWNARYAKADPLVLAGYVDAYVALIQATKERRERVVRELRRYVREIE